MSSESDKEILVRNDENDNEGVTPVQGGLGVKGAPFLSQSSSCNQLAVPDPALASNSSSRLSLTGSGSTVDLPFHSGNTGRSNNGVDVFNRELRGAGDEAADLSEEVTSKAWEVNYREAAIFLEEGENNDKFLHHPRDRESLPAYLLVHSRWFNIIDLCVSLVVLMLGFIEQDSSSNSIKILQVPIVVHSSIELCGLALMAVQLYLKTRWIGWRAFLRHKRSMMKTVTLVVMIAEAVTVIIRNKTHFRVTRALRVLFVTDTYYCGGVRRFLRQIFKSLPPILDMLGLLIFIMLIYSVLGFYMFGPTATKPGSPYFHSFLLSFINLFVLLTTANYPDVMMPSYSDHWYAFIFFFTYIMISLYFLMNLLLAVVYDAFTAEEVKKFKKLFLHKRLACHHAFKLLVTRENPDHICYAHFSGLISYFAPRASSPMNNLLMFKMLNKSQSGYITVEEFYNIYDVVEYNWKPKKERGPYYEDCKYPFSLISGAINIFVRSLAFTYTIYVIIFLNGVLLIVQTCYVDYEGQKTMDSDWISVIFIGIYTVEMILKLVGLGVTTYFQSPWNAFDFMITLAGIVCVALTEVGINSYYIMILRPLRLLRLFKVKKRFRDVFGTFVILLPRLNSALVILFLVFYFFGIIGVEIFGDYQLENCCKNTTVEPFYTWDKNSTGLGYYYLNNFHNLPRAYVTLFELMVVNNWHIIMEGYAQVTGSDWSRIFFMTFYLFTMVVVTIIVAFILEAFLFRIEYKQKMNKDEEMKQLSEVITLNREEIFFLDSTYEEMGKVGFKEFALESIEPNQDGLEFKGTKRRTKEELQKMMYTEKMTEWLEEAEREDSQRALDFQNSVLTNDAGSQEDSLQVLHTGHEDEVVTLRRQMMPQPRLSLPSMGVQS